MKVPGRVKDRKDTFIEVDNIRCYSGDKFIINKINNKNVHHGWPNVKLINDKQQKIFIYPVQRRKGKHISRPVGHGWVTSERSHQYRMTVKILPMVSRLIIRLFLENIKGHGGLLCCRCLKERVGLSNILRHCRICDWSCGSFDFPKTLWIVFGRARFDSEEVFEPKVD